MFRSSRPAQHEPSPEDGRPYALFKLRRLSSAWQRYYQNWYIAHYVLTVGSDVSALVVAEGPDGFGMDELVYRIISLFAGAAVVLLAVLSPQLKADRYSRARTMLEDQLLRAETFSDVDLAGAFAARLAAEAVLRPQTGS